MSVVFLCVYGGGWEKPGATTEHKGTSEVSHRTPRPPSYPPYSLLQSWACTLAVAPAAEARLLFKAALSFGLFFLSSLFFPLMSTEWLHRAPCLSHTSFTKPQKRERTNRDRGITKQDGDSSSAALPHSSLPLMTLWCQWKKKRHIFKVSPVFPTTLIVEMVWMQTNYMWVYSKYSGITSDVPNKKKTIIYAGVCRQAFKVLLSLEFWVTEKVELSSLWSWG